MARSTASIRFSGQPSASAASILTVDRTLLAHHAAQDVAEERGLGRLERDALDLAADPVRLELGEARRSRPCPRLHLVERLHGGEPRAAAALTRLSPWRGLLRERGA